MRLLLASDLKSRDGTTKKDAGSKNAVVEVSGETSGLIKRPGSLSLGSAGFGLAQLLACYNGQLKAIVGNTLADLVVKLKTYPGTAYNIPNATTHTTESIAFGNGVFACKCAKSTDGKNWTENPPVDFSPIGIAFGNGAFVAMTGGAGSGGGTGDSYHYKIYPGPTYPANGDYGGEDFLTIQAMIDWLTGMYDGNWVFSASGPMASGDPHYPQWIGYLVMDGNQSGEDYVQVLSAI